MSVIYISGPYTEGDVAINVRMAIHRGMQLNDLGNYAVIPHLTHFAHLMHPRPYEYWTRLDNMIIPKCDKLIRLPGESSGADKEVEFARSLDIEVVVEEEIIL